MEGRSYGNRNGGYGGGYGGGRGGYGGGNRGGGGGFVPVKEGEELDAEILSVAEKGDGVAKKQGFVIFVPGTKVGDKVKIRVTKVARKVAFAQVIGAASEVPAEEQSTATSEDSGSEESSEPAEEEQQYDSSQDSEEF